MFNTPSHHRVHHGANDQYLDKNYGGILILWDGCSAPSSRRVRRVKYGLTKNIDTYNPLRIAYHEYGRHRPRCVGEREGLHAKFHHVFGQARMDTTR